MNKTCSSVRSILVIDDDVDDFEIVSEAIKEIDPEISVYFLDRCEDCDKYKDHSFDLVLLDINMPHYDGFAWLQGIRKHGYNNLPIIMYTNSANPDNIVKAYDDGANLYFTKPESFSGLVKGLQKLINLDWTNPFYVTQLYRQNGRYATFDVE